MESAEAAIRRVAISGGQDELLLGGVYESNY